MELFLSLCLVGSALVGLALGRAERRSFMTMRRLFQEAEAEARWWSTVSVLQSRLLEGKLDDVEARYVVRQIDRLLAEREAAWSSSDASSGPS